MSFHFTLGGVLRLRESLERVELQRLQAIVAAVQLRRAEIESLDKDMEAARRRLSDVVVAVGMTGAELHFETARETTMSALRSELSKKLSDLEQKQKEQQAHYFQARAQREILSHLRDRQLAEYKLEQSRREQQRIDELFLIRRNSSANRSSN